MALSYYSNWATFEQEMFNSDLNILAPPETEQLPPELFNGGAAGFQDFHYTNIDNLFEPVNNDHLFYPLNFNLLCSDSNNLIKTEALQEFDPFRALKRPKFGNSHEQQLICPDFFMPGSANGLWDCTPEVVVPQLLEFPASPPPERPPGCGGSLSAQSIAARQRRRRITEKTHELAKLVPGGQRMNTAEMFQSAYKYIKFLQAQIGVLELMDSSYDDKENGDLFEIEESHCLLESPLIQEKLYSTENCLIPMKFVHALASDHRILESNPHVLKEVKKLGEN